VDWIDLAEDVDDWRILMKMEMDKNEIGKFAKARYTFSVKMSVFTV
jgi:hypothetical protein